MKIAGFSTRVVSVPREEGPLGDGPGTLASNFVTLKIQTDDGVEGIAYGGFASAVMVKALKEAMDRLTELIELSVLDDFVLEIHPEQVDGSSQQRPGISDSEFQIVEALRFGKRLVEVDRPSRIHFEFRKNAKARTCSIIEVHESGLAGCPGDAHIRV